CFRGPRCRGRLPCLARAAKAWHTTLLSTKSAPKSFGGRSTDRRVLVLFGMPGMATMPAALVEQRGDEGGPARLVRRAQSLPRVAMKVLVEREQVAQGGVVGEAAVGAEDRPLPGVVGEEQAAEACGQLVRALAQVHPPPRAGRALDPERLAVE